MRGGVDADQRRRDREGCDRDHMTCSLVEKWVPVTNKLFCSLGLDMNTREFDAAGGRIVEGYQPGCIGDVASLHGRFYSGHSGFGVFFEKKVATELAEFVGSLPTHNKALWLYMENGRSLASLAIDRDHMTGGAHLRWFIVEESLCGLGIGRRLMARAIAFVDEHFEETCLWTFKGLDAARNLYESFDFRLATEAEGAQWGTTVVEQQFKRPRPK